MTPSLYSAREVAQIVGLQESRVRYWAQTGFVGPSVKEGGRMMYNFQDLVGIKAAKELLDRGISLQRARKNLDALRTQLPQVSQPLAELRILSDGDQLVFAGADAPFEPLSGQLVMEFAVGALEGRVAEVMQLRGGGRAEHGGRGAETAWAWFLEGVQLDGSSDPAQEDAALIAYHKALDGDPQLAAAHTNLGALLYRRGELKEARRHFEEALRLDPEQPEARYNFANLCEELGEHDRAVGEWYRVATACPEFADAHFNLAQALAADGAREPARRHLQKYLELDGEGEWAERARQLYQSLF
jgi:tetratricopeptide (TPR) repeat protein